METYLVEIEKNTRSCLEEAKDLPMNISDDAADIRAMLQAILDRVYQIRIGLLALDKVKNDESV